MITMLDIYCSDLLRLVRKSFYFDRILEKLFFARRE
jgi:hypothetical protein